MISRQAAIEKAIMDYLHNDIALRGGTSRRLSKILYQIDWPGPLNDYEFSRAVNHLAKIGYIILEEIEGFGFVYAKPKV